LPRPREESDRSRRTDRKGCVAAVVDDRTLIVEVCNCPH